MAVGIATVVASAMEKDFEAVAAGVISTFIGAGLYMLADKIADRKMKKIAAKEAQKAEAEAIAPVSNRCPHCGTVLDPDDVFCYNCGTKRSS